MGHKLCGSCTVRNEARLGEGPVNPLAIPEIVIRRLPLYLRTLKLLADRGLTVTSSQEIGDRLGITATQVRKDLSYFGEFGKQGTGYEIKYLQEQLRQILQVDRTWKLALIGVGDLGRALLRFTAFEESGFEMAAVLDRDGAKIGRQVGRHTVLDVATLPAVIRERGIQVAVIAVPTRDAQEIADALVKAGIRAILSYAPIQLSLPQHIQVQQIDPILSLQGMTYYLDASQL